MAGDLLKAALVKSDEVHLVDGDVAYRFFATPERAFAVADTPGHERS
jgi:sulfate adenylyltransferase subunit 1 (EFTu-like GTPase family)